MNKKSITLGIVTAASLTAVCATLALHSNFGTLVFSAAEEYQMVLSDATVVESKDNGYMHEADIKNNKIDMIGFEEVEGKFGSVEEKTYGEGANALTYKGMVFNRSMINGILGINVTFTGEDLYCVFTEFLMEDMTFANGGKLTSGVTLAAPENMGYFIVYTGGEGKAIIDSLTVSYKCDGSLDDTIVLGKNSDLGGARSIAKHYERLDSHIEMENNPTRNTNNYSTGKSSADRNNSWYRWNGQYLAHSAGLGTDFTLHTTIMGNISQMIDPTSYFNYSVWPHFYPEGGTPDNDWGWTYVYLGNDTYEPLGKDDPNRVIHDSHADYSFAGRFFTTYRNYGDDEHELWEFADPDEFRTLDESNLTLREAYNAFTLPFWHVKFDVHVIFDEEDQKDWIVADCYINDFLISCDWLFPTSAATSLAIETYQMHLVNYGYPEETIVDDKVVHEGKPSYTGAFTYPRIEIE